MRIFNLRGVLTSLPIEVLLSIAVMTTPFLAGQERSSLRWLWLGLAIIFIALITLCRTLRLPQPSEYKQLSIRQADLVQSITGALVGILGNRSRAVRQNSSGKLLRAMLERTKNCGQTPELNRAAYFEIDQDSNGAKLVKREQRGRDDEPLRDFSYMDGPCWSREIIKHAQNPYAFPRCYNDTEREFQEGMPREAKSIVIAPVRNRRTPIGLLWVDSSQTKAFRKTDGIMMSSLGAVIGAAVACIECDVNMPPASAA